MSSAPRPGWYPDPAGSHDFRWWDGHAWTEAISESARAPRPDGRWRPGPALDDQARPSPQTPDGSGADSTPELWSRPAGPTPTAPPKDLTDLVTSSDAQGSADEDARRSPSTLKTLLVLTCSFAVFAAAGLGVGLLLWRDPSATSSAGTDPLLSPAPLAPGAQSAPRPPTGRLDESTRLATIGPASMTLPGAPYELYEDPMEIDGVFDTLFSANADVHADYDGKHSWSATVALAHVSPALTGSSDLGEAGSAAMAALSRNLFGGHPTTVRRLSSWDRAVDGHPGLMFTLDIHYAIPRLPSRYDSVTALVVRLDDGSLVAALSSVPNDAGLDVKRLARESIGSLSIG